MRHMLSAARAGGAHGERVREAGTGSWAPGVPTAVAAGSPWRTETLEVLAELCDLLVAETRQHPTPRGSWTLRERSHLLDEVNGQRLQVLCGGDPDRLLHDVGRLLEKVRSHLQRAEDA